MGRKRAGGLAPWTPGFMARSFPLAGFGVVGRSGAVVGLFRGPCTCPDFGRFFVLFLNSMSVDPFPSAKPPAPARPAGGRAVTGVRYRAAGQAKNKEPPAGSPQPEKVGPGRKNLFLPGVLSSGFLQRKPGSPAVVGGGNHVAGPTLRRSRRPQTWPPPGRRPTGRCAPRPVKAPPTWRVPIISPVAFLSRAPQNTARPPPAGRPPGRSTPRPPRLGGSSRPSPARGRRR